MMLISSELAIGYLGEKEAWQPEAVWDPLLQPVLHEGNPLVVVFEPASEWLERWIRHLVPQFWNLVAKHAVEHELQLSTHDHQTLDGFLKLHERAPHCARESVCIEISELYYQVQKQLLLL